VNALQLEVASSSALILTNSVVRMRTNCYFAVSYQNFDIAIRFSDPDFLKKQ